MVIPDLPYFTNLFLGKNCSALPVTPAKVVMFIKHERERSQLVKGRSNIEGGTRGVKEGTNLGKSLGVPEK